MVEQLLTGLFARGHVLLVGVPGLAKTLLVSTVAQILSLSFRRIQFTPDMMPSDITGTDILQDDPETGRRRFTFIAGPIFANMILADEINRTPPKTQAALLEAMQERHVTAGGSTYPLPDPFFVLATQNPIEQEGTYPLPEAQLDRFMLNVWSPTRRPTRSWRSSAGRPATRPPEPAVDALGRADRGASSTWCGACRCPTTSSSTPATSSAPAGRNEPEATATGAEVRLLGRRAARRPVADPGRQGPRRARTAGSTPRSPTSATSPGPSCGTGSSPPSTPRPRGSAPTRSSTTCSRRSPPPPSGPPARLFWAG